MPCAPHAGWLYEEVNPFTRAKARSLDELKAIVTFRYERLGDTEWAAAHELIERDSEERRLAKKARKEWRAP